ncbi:MAG TPA: hypothetical protein VIQ05_23270 [Tardiphaga sp.]
MQNAVAPKPQSFCKFAAGTSRGALTGVWQVTLSRKKPDLYISVGRTGEVKASIHCPQANRPTWKRHYRFDREARGAIADALRADNRIREEMTWNGCDLGMGRTLECRIMILGSGLNPTPIPVAKDVQLLPPPDPDKCLIVTLITGSAQSPPEFYVFSDVETSLLFSAKMVDGRPLWVTYCYAPPAKLPPVNGGRGYGNKETFAAAQMTRAALVAPNSDGSIVFVDTLVERTI